MRHKDYWADTTEDSEGPFSLTRKFAKGLRDATAETPDQAALPEVAKYLWIYVTNDRYQGLDSKSDSPALPLEDWLSVIDEAASLGSEWIVIAVGESLASCPMVWQLCSWAQETHGLRVAIHLAASDSVGHHADYFEGLNASLTWLIAEDSVLKSLEPLRVKGVQLVEATVSEEDRHSTCTVPSSMLCVGIDGELFTCGLVLGEDRYHLGNVFARGLKDVVQDDSLPHTVSCTEQYPSHGCDGCPPYLAQRILGLLPE